MTLFIFILFALLWQLLAESFIGGISVPNTQLFVKLRPRIWKDGVDIYMCKVIFLCIQSFVNSSLTLKL